MKNDYSVCRSIYLPKSEYDELEKIAQRKHQKVGELIRIAIKEYNDKQRNLEKGKTDVSK